ncbi:MAG TPA: DUF3455 domain-containing protein, partial [Haliangiales bacterium]|nr:DUF3455 domain-containing protein [Haliangiales bacterium]
ALVLGCGGARVAMPPIPDALKPPADQALILEAHATGVQIYECKPSKDDPAKFEWALTGPEADLSDAGGKAIGKHYAGPTWETADGSKVVGEVKARDPGPDPTSIPWLMLTAKSTSGTGPLAKTATILRLKTQGGKAAPEGCSQTQAGSETRVPYRATYYFYGLK